LKTIFQKNLIKILVVIIKRLLDWSIKNSPEFWSSFWDFTKIKGIKSDKKIRKSKIFYKNLFLPIVN